MHNAYVHGLLVDYLIPKVYLVEFFLLPFLILGINQFKKFKLNKFISILVLVLLIRQLFSPNIMASLTYLLHLTEVFLFFYIIRRDSLFKTKTADQVGLFTIVGTIIFQSLLAIYQFIFQRSLLAYQFLGETNLHNLANISHAQFSFGERILPYGTTAHPNILAGLVVIFSIIAINKMRHSIVFITLNTFLIIFLTQSLSALLTVVLFIVYLLLNQLRNKAKKQVVTMLICCSFLIISPFLLGLLPNSDSINRRVALNHVAWQMFVKQPIFGVGLNNFTVVAENYSVGTINKEIVRFVQPVHHLPLLILSEGGILLLLIFFLLIQKTKVNNFYQKTIVLLAIASLDHYLFTQFLGLGILILFYFFMALESSSDSDSPSD